jgi:hypothetical protein
VKDEEEDEELMYGEFDMGFFLALLETLEGGLAALEGGGSGGVFVDVGSGRGQLAVLAAAARPWARCTGLEYMPVLHAIADQVQVSMGTGAPWWAAGPLGGDPVQSESSWTRSVKAPGFSPW